MKGKWISVLVGLALVFGPVGAWPQKIYVADSDIVISEVMFNSYCNNGVSGSDTTCTPGSGTFETQFEWVEIYNKGASAVNIQNWQICDSTGCDTITTLSTLIGPGEYWLIGNFQQGLQAELTNANYGSYTASRTLLLGTSTTPNPIGGNGLSNTADAVYLKTGPTGNVTDCISWASPAGTTCSGLTYVSAGDGFDSNLASEGNGQSITNIQGTWYYHNANGNASGSPYASNTASGGSPTAITLLSLAAASPLPAALPVLGLVALGGLAAVAALGIGAGLVRRRRA